MLIVNEFTEQNVLPVFTHDLGQTENAKGLNNQLVSLQFTRKGKGEWEQWTKKH
jgi:hypothetical protein